MSKNIVLAGCVILDQDNRVLLLHRQTAAIDHWEVPGGKKEKGESPKTTVTREAREELGLDVQIVRSIGVANFRYEDTDMVYHYFLCSTNGTPIVGEPETFSEFAYVSLQSTDQLLYKLSQGAEVLARLLQQG